jgi:hypothetical protein
MAEAPDPNATWLPVIGRTLAYLCFKQAQHEQPEKFINVLSRVKFLRGLGFPRRTPRTLPGARRPRSGCC